jgi:gliding motility-associated-like protein
MKLSIHLYIILIFSILLNINVYAQGSCTVCNNADFESGSGGGWTYSDGSDADSAPGQCGGCSPLCGNPPPIICVTSTGFRNPQHALQTVGNFDPLVGGTILPVVPPFGGNQSLRLGDGDKAGAKAARATFEYLVTPATANFTYRYSIIVEDPISAPHNNVQRPYFNVSVRDAKGNKISCGDLYVFAQPPMTDFTQCIPPKKDNRDIFYRGWSTVVLPLAAYIGECVSIEFTTGDCARGAHIGYAYIDASCGPADVVTSAPNACGGYRLAAPTNASAYKWTNKVDGSSKGIEGPSDKQTVDVNRAGTYQVVMSSLAGPNCASTLEMTVGNPGPSPAAFTPFTGCAGSYTQFTDISTPTDPATGWAWDFNNDKVVDAVIKNPIHAFPANGIYPVTLTIFSGNCSASVTDSVYVDLPIYPVVDPAGPFCLNADSVKLNTSIPGGTWSGPGITNAKAGIFTPSTANIGKNSIIYATQESCPGKDTIEIIINAPTADAGRDIAICTGNTGNLGAASTVNYSYSWLPITGLNSINISNPTVTLSNIQNTPTIYSYTVTTTNTLSNCVATDVVEVTVNSLPIIDAGPDQTICEGSKVTLEGTAAGATTSYTWGNGSGIYTPNNTMLNAVYTPNAFEVANNNVTLILTSNDPIGPCTAVSDTMNITIKPQATINAGNDQTICVGSLAYLNGTLGGSATSGTWSGGNGIFSPNNNTPNASYKPSTTEETSGFFSLTFTSNISLASICPSVSDQIKITINQLPIVDAGSDQTICTGSVTLSGLLGGAATSAIWSGGAGTFNPNNSTKNANYTPSAAEIKVGGVTLTLTSNVAGACAPATDQMIIKINPLATVNAGIDQSICINSKTVGNTVILAATFNNTVTGGVWSGGAGIFNPDNTDPNAIYTLSLSETSKASVALTFITNDPVGPCPAVNDQMILFIDQPPVVNAGVDQTICNGSTVNLAGTINGLVTSATWSGGSGTYSPNNTSLNCVYTPSTAEISIGSVVLTLTTNDPSGPCSSVNDQVIITINPLALASAGASQTICSGNIVNLVGIFNGSATSGLWSGGSGTFSPPTVEIAVTTYTPSANDITAGGVNLTYTTNDPIGPCLAASDILTITINDMPTVNAGTVKATCIGLPVNLSGTIGGSATNATWTGGKGTYLPDSTTLKAIYTPSAAEYASGTVVLTLTTNDPTGPCPPVSSNVTINIFQVPVVNFIVDDPDGCPEHCVQFTDFTSVNGVNSITNWNWTFGDGKKSAQQSPAHCYKETGKYDVELSVTDKNSCKASLKYDKMITVYSIPVAEFSTTPSPASVLEHNVTFINQSSTDVNFWMWDFGDGDTLAPDTKNPIHTYASIPNSIYHATLQVHNADFCFASITHQIKIEPEFTFFIPNAFTPRASAGLNDVFNGKGIGIIKYDLWIFDRWGNTVFHSSDLDEGWDGKANGGKHVAQEDVYVWKVHLTDVFHKQHSYLGTVTLVK